MLFVGYTALLSAYALVLLACRMVYAGASAHTGVPRTRASVAAESSQFLMMGLLFFEAVLFGLFTLAMFTEQISSILADQTGIERLKHDYVAPQRSSMQNLSETFGKPFSLLWLLPTAVKFHGLTYRDLLAEEMMADMECSPCV